MTGAAGMLGSDVVADARSKAHEVTALTRSDLDVTDPVAVDDAIAEVQPAAVINCAAWTDVDGAEENHDMASRVNGEGAGFLAGAAESVQAKMLQVSTDYVFDGSKDGAYTEADKPAPLQVYGVTKLAGEKAVALTCERHFIVRTSWLFGPCGPNFVETMLRLGEGGGPLTVVHDQVGCPTYTGHLADGLVRLIEGSSYGTHHMAGSGSASWYEFAMEVFRRSDADAKVMATTSDEFARPAKRPANSRLVSARSLAIKLPPWQDGLAAYLTRIEAERGEEASP